MTARTYYIICALLLLVYLANGIYAIPRLSPTSDEGDHMSYALRFLRGHPEKIVRYDDGSTMPITALNGLPRAAEQLARPGLVKSDGGVSDILAGRYITLFVCLLIGLFIAQWSRELFGNPAGAFSLLLFVFCPNTIANTWLVTTDAYAALLVLLTAYYFYRFSKQGDWKNLILFSVGMGIAQGTKQSLVLLFFFYGVLALIILIRRGSWRQRKKINFLRLLVFGLVMLFTLNALFLFNGSGRALADYNFHSSFFRQMQQWPVIGRLPLPLPAPFLEGFDMVKQMLSFGSGHEATSPRSYLFGQYFTGKGPWYYYPVLFLFKTPLAVLLLVLFYPLLWFKDRSRSWYYFYPLLPAVFFIVSVIALNTSQHSLRHLVMVYPLAYVALGYWLKKGLLSAKWIIPVVVLYSVISFYSYFPNIISYTNELLWNKTKVYRVLASSNIDFGQSYYSVQRYRRDHPEVQWPPAQPAAGRFAIGINDYLDLRNTGQFAWLRNFEPVSTIDHCYLLIDVSEAALQEKGLK